ncbi:MAG: hypothetical protein KA155_08935 [Alphaproteobacteria bacterium]|jgi:uncharacterized protein YxeA|nr:hypothetical protein [Alphaproteobacteria bacterium]
MATDVNNNDHGGLYFIVGALVVVAVIAGVYFIQNDQVDNPNTPSVIERTERTIERTTTDDNDANSSSLEMRIDEDGASATTTRND